MQSPGILMDHPFNIPYAFFVALQFCNMDFYSTTPETVHMQFPKNIAKKNLNCQTKIHELPIDFY